MSVTSCQQPSTSRPIPTKTLFIKDLSELPHCYSSTPGGTLFSTTPGGTRIIYDRKFLLDCRNSPIARTPPRYLPHIPGVTSSQHTSPCKLEDLKEQDETEPEIPAEEDQFEMDI